VNGLKEFIFDRLSQTSAGNRVYPNVTRHEGRERVIIYQVVSDGSIQSTFGGSGVFRSIVQVTCYADRYDSAFDLSEECRIILDGFFGAAGGTTVQHCLMDQGSRRDVPSLTGDSELQTRFGVLLDFKIMYTAPVPNP